VPVFESYSPPGKLWSPSLHIPSRSFGRKACEESEHANASVLTPKDAGPVTTAPD